MRILALEERMWWQNSVFSHAIHSQLPLTHEQDGQEKSSPFPPASLHTSPQLLLTPTLFLFFFPTEPEATFISRGSSLGRVYFVFIRANEDLSLKKLVGTGQSVETENGVCSVPQALSPPDGSFSPLLGCRKDVSKPNVLSSLSNI